MNRDQYEVHGLWATLDDFNSVISGDLSGKDDARRDSIRRLHSVSAYLSSLRGLDPALVDAPSLDQINSRHHLAPEPSVGQRPVQAEPQSASLKGCAWPRARVGPSRSRPQVPASAAPGTPHL